jgi:hypothetical protein
VPADSIRAVAQTEPSAHRRRSSADLRGAYTHPYVVHGAPISNCNGRLGVRPEKAPSIRQILKQWTEVHGLPIVPSVEGIVDNFSLRLQLSKQLVRFIEECLFLRQMINVVTKPNRNRFIVRNPLDPVVYVF